jgi:multidrug efflux pump
MSATAKGRDGAVLGLCHGPLAVRFTPAGTLQRHSVGGDHGAGCARVSVPARRCRDGEDGGQAAPGIGYEWTGLSYEEKKAGAQAPALYAISLLVVFLAVAALYESWTIPFVNLLMLPLGLVGAVTAVTLRLLPNDVYLQIGLLTTVGLSTKNAILIIQFIKEQMHQGHELVDATLSAVKIRLRPVIMTSLAFFFGTLPLALTKGAGAAAQNAIGTAVTGGLLSATFIDLIFIPFFFVMVSRLFGRKKYKKHDGEPAVAAVVEGH